MAVRVSSELPKRAWLPLFVLDHVDKIVTKLKLQKLIFLIENDAKVIDYYDFKKKHYGPYSEELEIDFNLFTENKLINSDIVYGRHKYWVYSIRLEGNRCLDMLLSEVEDREISKIIEPLEKYINMDHNELVELVYKKYWLNDEANLDKEIKSITKLIKDNMLFFEENYDPRYDTMLDVLAYTEYCHKAIEKSKTENNLIKSVIINSTKELLYNFSEIADTCLNNGNINPNSSSCIVSQPTKPDLYEIFQFIEYYCSKNSILPSLDNIDFSDFIKEEELERLQRDILEDLLK